MLTHDSPKPVPNALDIPNTTAAEAYTLLQVELERFLSLLEKLEADDWNKPTACTAWTVRDMLAHQAGGYASGSGYLELIRQYSARPQNGQLPEDAINALQIRERRDKSADEIVAELRLVGPPAIHNWAYRFRLAKQLTRLIKVSHPVSGTISFEYLMWVIHSRDTWMHRLDICRATDHHFQQSAEHDGRIAALVMLDVAKALTPHLTNQALIFELTGVAGGTWKVGAGQAVATVRMDVLDFNIFASGRFTFDQALARMEISGDVGVAQAALKDLLILY
jgi:uncharacterized protein (TIGR03083 family)